MLIFLCFGFPYGSWALFRNVRNIPMFFFSVLIIMVSLHIVLDMAVLVMVVVVELIVVIELSIHKY